MIVVIDNYDSFTFNIVQAIGALDRQRDIRVVRNDAVTPDDVEDWQPTHIVVSPGPCTPRESGNSRDVIRCLAGRVPILGVCLGHQCIADVFGASVVRAGRIMHGKTSPVYHVGDGLYDKLPNPFVATRYHSLIVDEATLPPQWERTAWTQTGELMGMRHRSMPVEGVQFHPESFLTVEGPRLLSNFLRQLPRSNGPIPDGRLTMVD
ncbi:MAG: aminodeoxychorismate/anthranilate synthase component II [Planctomycetota bacterium]